MHAREAGRHELSIGLIGHALQLAADDRERTVATIRLGEAYRGAQRYDEAERLLRSALDLDVSYRDFALQHLGKTLTDTGRFAEARECLEEALALRRAKGDAELVASTEAALAATRRSADSSSSSSSAPEPC